MIKLGHIWARIRLAFVTGLLVLLPTIVSLWVLNKLTESLDNAFQLFLKPLLKRQIPGLGIILGLLIIIGVGLMTPYYIGRVIKQAMDRVMSRIPLIRGIYRTTTQLIEVLKSSRQERYKRVVAIEYPRRGLYTIGFVTEVVKGPWRERLGHASNGEHGPRPLAYVFIPTTPNPTSGYLVVVPEDELVYLDIKQEDAVRLVVSGGLIQQDQELSTMSLTQAHDDHDST